MARQSISRSCSSSKSGGSRRYRFACSSRLTTNKLACSPVAGIRGGNRRCRRTCTPVFATGACVSLLGGVAARIPLRSEEHTSELQSHSDLVCRLLLEKKKEDGCKGHRLH